MVTNEPLELSLAIREHPGLRDPKERTVGQPSLPGAFLPVLPLSDLDLAEICGPCGHLRFKLRPGEPLEDFELNRTILPLVRRVGGGAEAAVPEVPQVQHLGKAGADRDDITAPELRVEGHRRLVLDVELPRRAQQPEERLGLEKQLLELVPEGAIEGQLRVLLLLPVCLFGHVSSHLAQACHQTPSGIGTAPGIRVAYSPGLAVWIGTTRSGRIASTRRFRSDT